ncbi:Centromere protein S [Fulvia fulva]|uniref:Centromere protein S n=1 Tax=Passalora fulva TaxID=5499 RepID=A0A9Q8L6B0_PASFU|nr:Centromere protein S [Fulvia fulva]KAK4636033.1 Centromere protein S [Fulvia fulva]KAK4637502.1 Centromere protein S [Fulvia fulva]UJO11614.1 Centromere protein S [Fulvia fulva]WPV10226.1 Centromere protein S [Fulvia fulva]WPV24790.1 Centromere protein S [Fulvia fulva]
MPELTQNNNANEEKLKAALWYSIGKTVDAVALDTNINATPQYIAGLTELVHAKINTAAADMEAFAKHADRTTINSKDVLLLARSNEALQHMLEENADTVRKSDRASKR